MTRSLTLPDERKFCGPPQPVLFRRLRLRQVKAPVMNGRKAHKMSTTEQTGMPSRIVIVGASLAGLHAAEQLRDEGFDGHIVLIGDEPYEPYDRPPLSKQVLIGWVEASSTALPRRGALDVEWKLGVPAVGLDLLTKRVQLADGQEVSFDRLLIATGTRARPWPNKQEASLDGLFVLRTRDDASRLRERLATQPKRVLIIGAGFTGSEMASACRELGLAVTVAERGPYPLVGALGGVVGAIAAEIQHQNGVDLRCGVTVTRLEGDTRGRLQRAHFSDGRTLDVDLAVVALGAVRNTEWLRDSGLAVGDLGVACDAGCRAFDLNAIVTDDIFVAGDVARFPHPLYDYQLLALEHWGNAIAQAEIAAHNMICSAYERRPHVSVPAFWSTQFGINIKSVGVPTFADEVALVQGSVQERRFVAAYSKKGRIVAAVAFNQTRWLDFYRGLIESAASLSEQLRTVDGHEQVVPVSADFPNPALPTHSAQIQLTGHAPNGLRAMYKALRL
jgi:NADPH-dependent 2,4-dienoyl-CoA reductase/sulfur reductase-like enzyme